MTGHLPPPGTPSADGRRPMPDHAVAAREGAATDRAATDRAALDRAALELGAAAGEAVQGAPLPPPLPGVGAVPRRLRGRAGEVPAQVKVRARKLVSLAFAQVWEQPLPVATEQLLVAALLEAADDDEIRERLKSLGGMAATAAAARAARWARRFPAGRVLLVATTAMEVAAAARRGSKEIKAVGSYLLVQARAAGVEVDRDRWERATMELVLKPGVHPSLDVGVPTLVTKLAGSWTYRAVVPFGDRKAPKKAHAMARGAAQFRVQHLRRS